MNEYDNAKILKNLLFKIDEKYLERNESEIVNVDTIESIETLEKSNL